MGEFSPIKINIRDKNNRPTSTTINFHICKYYCERLAIFANVHINPNRKEIQQVTQHFINITQKSGIRLTKDQIEKRLLHESTIATIRNYQIMMNKVY